MSSAHHKIWNKLKILKSLNNQQTNQIQIFVLCFRTIRSNKFKDFLAFHTCLLRYVFTILVYSYTIRSLFHRKLPFLSYSVSFLRQQYCFLKLRTDEPNKIKFIQLENIETDKKRLMEPEFEPAVPLYSGPLLRLRSNLKTKPTVPKGRQNKFWIRDTYLEPGRFAVTKPTAYMLVHVWTHLITSSVMLN